MFKAPVTCPLQWGQWAPSKIPLKQFLESGRSIRVEDGRQIVAVRRACDGVQPAPDAPEHAARRSPVAKRSRQVARHGLAHGQPRIPPARSRASSPASGRPAGAAAGGAGGRVRRVFIPRSLY